MMKLSLYDCKIILIIAILLFPMPAVTKEHGKQVRCEVQQLIEFVRISNCRFFRNGSWFEAGKAAAHLDKKYQYVQRRGLVTSAEDFIKYAATKSSISGKPYMVECKEGESRKCAEWLAAELV